MAENQKTDESAIIIGAGIGGLSAAIALRQVGVNAIVYERAPQLVAIGAGIPLWANAIRVLNKLGLGEAVNAASEPGTLGEIRSWQGGLLAEIKSTRLVRKYGALHIGMHRADLQSILLKGLGEGPVQLGAECTGFRQDVHGVTAEFANGREERASFLVGADGMNSVVRARLFGTDKKRYTGYTAWRGVARLEHDFFPLNVGIEIWGRGQRFGMSHISKGRIYWFATKNTREGEQDKAIGRKLELLHYFREWQNSIREVIEATDEGAILRNDIYEHRPRRRWGTGRVTLLGDAAHTMTPNLGQGACQAIEDALILSECLKIVGSATSALRSYEARRILRTMAVSKQSQLVGRFAQVENPVACWLRDTITKLTPSVVFSKQIEWIVGYETGCKQKRRQSG